MEILVIGDEVNLKECRQKFGDQHLYSVAEDHSDTKEFLKTESIIFDFKMKEDPNKITFYQGFNGIAFLDLSKNSLGQIVNSAHARATFFGFIGLPTFVNREILEVSLSREMDLKKLEEV